MRKSNFLSTISVIVLFAVYLQSGANAQTFIIKDIPHDRLSADFRFIHPFYKSPGSLSVLSGTYDLNLSVPIGSKWNINSLIPIVVYKYKIEEQLYSYNYSYSYDKTALGNVYLGLQTRDSTSPNLGRNFSFGIFLPTTDKNEAYSANFFGLLTNYYDLQKYVPETVTLYSNLAFRWYLENGISIGLDVGPQYLLTISDKGNRGSDFFLHYGLSGGLSIEGFAIKSEFTGILILTGDAANFSDRFMNFFSLGLGYNNFVVKPALFYQLNFHEMYKEFSSGSIGLKFSFVME